MGFLMAQEDITDSGGVGSGGYAFGFKGGPTVATQTWNGFQRNALFSYHGSAFVEAMGRWNDKNAVAKRSSFQAELGYQRKGSTFRNVFFYNQGNQKVSIPSNLFHNISLTLLGKGAFKIKERSLAYYAIGLNLNYTVNYQLVGMGSSAGVNRFNYGIWLGGGYEWQLGKGPWAFFIEANINPDISKQVFMPPGLRTQYQDPVSGQPIYTTEQKVYNLVFEFSLGVKINK